MRKISYNVFVIALLIAAGILIPVFSPFKLVYEPASFTLAVHVPIFIAVFISPVVAFTVSVGTAAGFAVGGFSDVIVWRAASHLLFAVLGALYLKLNPDTLKKSLFKITAFSVTAGVVHAWAEAAIVCFFYMKGDIPGTYYTYDTVIMLVGVGGFLHSMVDFTIAFLLFAAVRKIAPRFGGIGARRSGV